MLANLAWSSWYHCVSTWFILTFGQINYSSISVCPVTYVLGFDNYSRVILNILYTCMHAIGYGLCKFTCISFMLSNTESHITEWFGTFTFSALQFSLSTLVHLCLCTCIYFMLLKIESPIVHQAGHFRQSSSHASFFGAYHSSGLTNIWNICSSDAFVFNFLFSVSLLTGYINRI